MKKRVVTLCLVLALLLGLLPTGALAAAEDEAIRQALLTSVDEEEYPQGMFDFLTPRMETSEDVGEAEFAIVRRGNTDAAASVTFKAIDMTAKYGEDYTLEVPGVFFDKELPQDLEAQSLSEGGVYDLQEDAVVLAEEPARETDLRGARTVLTGERSDPTTWREADSGETAMLAETYGELYDELPGVEYVLRFAPGEYIKTLKFVTIDDTVSEDDEQVLFVLSHPVNGAISENPTGFMNIKDNEEPEEITFGFAEDGVTVPQDGFKATVTVERKTGLQRYGTVIVSSAEGTAAEGEYYDGFAAELTFVPGQQFQKIEIPIKKHPGLGDVSFLVYLDETGEAVTVTVQGARSAEASEDNAAATLAANEGAQLFAANNDALWCRQTTVRPGVSFSGASQQGYMTADGWARLWMNLNNRANATATATLNVDLSMVGKLKTKSDESWNGTWWESGWWFWYKSGYHTDMWTKVLIGNTEKVSRKGKFSVTEDTITLNDADRSAGKVVYQITTSGNTKDVQSGFSRDLLLYYLPIEVQLVDRADSDSMIQKRIYTSPTQYTNDGNAFLAGGLKFQGESANVTSKFFYNDDIVTLEETNRTEPDNTYLWGIKFETKAGSTTDFFYYKGNSFSIKDLYTGKLKDVNGSTINNTRAKLSDTINGETFPCYRVSPVYRQKTAFTTIKLDESKSQFATGTWKSEETVKTGVLDKLQISIAGKGDWAVSGFELYQGNRNHAAVTSTATERALADAATSDGQKIYQKTRFTRISGWTQALVNADVATPGNYLFSPTKTDNVLTALYQKPEITVAVNPRANSKDAQSKGFVAYADKDGNGQVAKYTGTGSNGLLRGDEIKIAPYRVGGIYPLVGGFPDPTETGYKFQWQDFTGDIDRDGQLSYEEIKALGSAYDSINKGVYAGDIFDYAPRVMSSPIVYFNIVPKAQNDTGIMNSLSGNVLLKTCSVIENSKSRPQYKTEPIQGAKIAAGDVLTTTNAQGRWEIKSASLDVGETYTATLVYGGRSYIGDVTVNRAATDFVVDEYNTFDVKNFNAFRVTNDSEYENVEDWNLHPLSNSAISNEDKRHLYTFEIDELLPTTATVGRVEVERYGADGTLKKTYTAVYNGENDLYEVKDPDLLEQYKDNLAAYNYSFDPAAETVAAGDYLTVRVFDQYDVGYIKHNIGFTYKPKLSVINLVNSFKSPVNPVLEYIGEMDLAFDLGVSAKMDMLDDKLSDAVESKLDVETSVDERIISFGWNKDFKKSYDSSKKKDNKKDPAASPVPTESPAPQSAAEKIKDEAKKLEEASDKPDSEKTPAEKEKDDKLKSEAADTAKEAVDKEDKENKKTSKVTADLKVNLSVALELVMGYDKAANRYYFKDFVVTGVVSGAASSKYEYTTPIGIVIFVKGELSGDITAMLAMEPYYQNPAQPSYLYMDEAGTIDLTKLGNADVNRQLSIYGKLMIRPKVTLSVGASLLSDKVASVSLEGSAKFDMVFTTAGDGAGNVTLNADLVLDILGGMVTKKWHLADKKYDMFSLNGGSLSRLMSMDGDYRYDVITPEDTDQKLYLKNRGGWDENGGISLLSTGTDRYNEQLLQTGAYPHAYPQIFMLSEGRAYDGSDSEQLLLYLDSDSEKVCLMYSIYQDSGDGRGYTWTQPSPVDANTAGDDTPQVEGLGDKLLITWSSQEAVAADDPVARLNSRDIKAAFFDKTAKTLSEPQYVTRTTAADRTADDYASASYYVGQDGKRQLLVTYVKTQYEQTGDELVVGDLLEAYSTIAYRFYDFDAGAWVETYSDQAAQSLMSTMSAQDAAAFAENWYGQGFVDLSQYVSVDESALAIQESDPDLGAYAGLWSRAPRAGEVSLATLSSDPKVLEHETINCGKYAVSAYLVDLDGGSGTIHDRDIFLQLYDFEAERFYPALRLTNDAHNQSYLELADTPDGVKLYYISNGSIAQQNISHLVDNMLAMKDRDGNDVLVLNKRHQVYRGEEIILAAPEDDPYTEFIVNSDGSNVYLTWTERGISFKDGVDRHSDAATLPENYYAERQMYMAMETYEETEYTHTDENGNPLTYPAVSETDGSAIDWTVTPDINGEVGKVQAGDPIVEKLYVSRWSQPVQMTDEQGANYSDIDCVMVAGGVLRCVYLKGMSKVMEISGEKHPVEDVNDRSLISADFNFNVERYTVSIDNLSEVTVGREAMPVVVTVKNESLLTMPEVHLTLSMGKNGETTPIAEETFERIGGGESVTATLLWDVPPSLDGVSLTAAVDQGGLDYGGVTKEFQRDSLIEITDVSHEMLDRNAAQFTVWVVNSGSENATGERVYLSCGDVEYASGEFDLVAGGETAVTLTAQIPEEVFTEARTETTITETAPVKVYTDGSIEDYAIVRSADAALEALMSGDLGLADKNGNAYTERLQLAVGELLLLESDSADPVNAPRVHIFSDNEAVVSVTNGVLTGEKMGTAKLQVELYPRMDTYAADDSGSMQAESVYNTLPSCLIQTRELTAQVSSGGGSSSSGSRPRPSTPSTSAESTRFADVAEGAWYQDAVAYVTKAGLFNGTSETTFSPNVTMTRAMLATVLYRAAGEPAMPEANWGYPYADVDANAYYTTAVYWARHNDIVTGYDNGGFGPDDPITREQLAVMLWRYAGEPAADGTLDKFTDSGQAGSWAADALRWAVERGILTGKGGGILDPKGQATRAEVAAMLTRYLKRDL